MKKAKVEFKNITKKFNNTVAVNNVSCTFEPGTLTTLLGPSGCGKTTSLRIIAGLERATSGQILIDGEDVTILPATERDVSMVFQSYALFPHMSVMENVSYGLRMINKNKEEYTEKTFNTLELVGLKGYQDRMPSELSGGQQQRVALARTLVVKPKVLLLDEPFSNLDAKLRDQVRIEIRRIQKEYGLTAIFVTHDQEEALTMSDRIAVIEGGQVQQVGRDLYNYPNNKFVANFIGDSNIIKVSIVSHQQDNYEIKIDKKVFKIKSSIQGHKDEPHVLKAR